MRPSDWFQNRLGITPEDYELVANVHHGACLYSADFNAVDRQSPNLAPAMRNLLDLSSLTPEQFLERASEPSFLYDAVNHAEPLLIRPLLKVGNRYLVTSLANLFNKFHRGLPYLALETRTSMDQRKSADSRGEFGYLFQGYISWLFNNWFGGSSVEVVPEYWTAGIGLSSAPGEPYEKRSAASGRYGVCV